MITRKKDTFNKQIFQYLSKQFYEYFSRIDILINAFDLSTKIELIKINKVYWYKTWYLVFHLFGVNGIMTKIDLFKQRFLSIYKIILVNKRYNYLTADGR